jgi:hypothetical protein
LLRHSDASTQRIEKQAIGVLEKRNEPSPFLEPFLRHALLVQQEMNVPMAVGLCEQLVRRIIRRQSSGGVDERADLLLLQDSHLVAVHAKVFIIFQKLDGALAGVTRDHNREWEFHWWLRMRA